MTKRNFYPVVLSRLSDEDDTIENQAERAITWLCKQSGGDITVITPRKYFENNAIKQLIKIKGVKHYSWREKTAGTLLAAYYTHGQIMKD